MIISELIEVLEALRHVRGDIECQIGVGEDPRGEVFNRCVGLYHIKSIGTVTGPDGPTACLEAEKPGYLLRIHR